MASKIEWTEDTWNPIIGCDKVSAGCKNCYAIQTAWIRQHNPKMKDKYDGVVEKTANGSLNWTGKINMHEPSLLKPLLTKKPTTYFVNSMSDLFHPKISFDFIDKIFSIMKACPQHTFQILTKRAGRMAEYFSKWRPQILDDAYLALMGNEMLNNYLPSMICYHQKNGIEGWPLQNVWIGVSVEDQKAADERIPYLLQVPAAVRFLSCEPLLGPVNLCEVETKDETLDVLNKFGNSVGGACGDLSYGIDWVIVGGESGKGSRPVHPDWIRSLRDQCKVANVPFFFKQWGNWLPFEPDAQPPFYNACSNNESFDSHGMNFTDPETDSPGKWNGGTWMDGMDAIIFCEEYEADQCMFLRLPKSKMPKKIDGKVHNEYPVQFSSG